MGLEGRRLVMFLSPEDFNFENLRIEIILILLIIVFILVTIVLICDRCENRLCCRNSAKYTDDEAIV